MADILKINYDDFYKFLVSGGVLTVIVFSAVSSFFLNTSSNYDWRFWVAVMYFIFAILGGGAAAYGVLKWRCNQKLLDKKLRLDVNIRELEYKESRLRFRDLERQLNPKYSRIAKYLPEDRPQIGE